MRTILQVLSLLTATLFICAVVNLIRDLNNANGMELGALVIIPIDLFVIAYYTLISIASYKVLKKHSTLPSEVSNPTIILLAILLILPVLFELYLYNLI